MICKRWGGGGGGGSGGVTKVQSYYSTISV